MAISAIVRLVDNMSGPINDIISAMNIMTDEMKRVSGVGDNAFNGAEIDEMREKIESADIKMQELAGSTDEAVAKMARLGDEASEASNNTKNIGSGMDGFVGRLSSGLNTLKNMAGVAAAIKIGGDVVQLSDKMAQTEARLSLVVDDGGSVDELQQKIYQSAQRSRADYLSMADTVAGLAQRAGDAFTSNDEAIAFAENLNKQFIIAGASQEEISSVSLQLTQALGSGALRGEELNAVFEAAPNIIQTITDYMGVPIGQIRNLASEGKITAEIIKNAMLGATGDINAQFGSMSMTWGQRWTAFKNAALMAFQPVLTKINEIANSEKINGFITNATGALYIIADVIGYVFEGIGTVVGFVVDAIGALAPVIGTVVTALGVYVAYMGIVKTATLLTAGAKIGAAIAAYAHAWATKTEVGATALLTVEQYKLNSAFLSCPLVWIIGLIVLIVLAIYAVVKAINAVKGSTISGTGVIIGALNAAAAIIQNLFFGLLTLSFTIIENIWNTFVSFANFLANVFNDPIGSIVHLFTDMADRIFNIIEGITKAIDFAFGTNLSGVVSGFREKMAGIVDNWIEERGSEYEEKFQKLDIEGTLSNMGLPLERKDVSDAYDSGYSAGEALETYGLSLFSSDDFNSLGGNTGLDDLNYPVDYFDNAFTNALDNTGLGTDYSDNLGAIESNTADIADSLESTDLEWLYDIAEREAINKFTTAEVRVEMGGVTNHLSSDMDIDGFVNKLTSKVEEALAVSAEGVHQ